MALSWTVTARLLGTGIALSLLTACEDGFDLDMRGGLGGSLDTSAAARTATTERPSPDSRGIISYPGYQVAVARRGDTVTDVAARVGVPAERLASYNGIDAEATLRQDEIIALPYRVAEPASGVVTPPGEAVDIAAIAGSAIDSAEPAVSTETLSPAPKTTTPAPKKTQTGVEPVRHKVVRGETAFSIARLYDVSVRSLADWNGLGSDFTIRENQILLIPPAAPSAQPAAASTAAVATTKPGEGSATPVPPSASKPLPPDDTTATVKPESPDLGQTQSSTNSKMSYPVDGKIIRPYSKGKNNGIDISGKAGAPVQAASDGSVAAITTDADQITILVLRHADNLMTVYYNVDAVAVSKGATVKRGQQIASLPDKDSFVHFEVRDGFDSVDPMPFLGDK